MRQATGCPILGFTLGLAGLSLAMVTGLRHAHRSIDVVELERAARLGSPVLQAARARAQEALMALPRGGRVRGDPELELWVRNALPELSDATVQPVAVPGRGRPAGALARQARHARSRRRRRTWATLVAVVVAGAEAGGRVRRTFAELYAADREQRTLAEAHELLRLLHATAGRASPPPGTAGGARARSPGRADQNRPRLFAFPGGARARKLAESARDPSAAPRRGYRAGLRGAQGPLPFDDRAPTVPAASCASPRPRSASKRAARSQAGLRRRRRFLSWPEGNPELTVKLGMGSLPPPALRAAGLGDGATSSRRVPKVAAERGGRTREVVRAPSATTSSAASRLAGTIVPHERGARRSTGRFPQRRRDFFFAPSRTVQRLVSRAHRVVERRSRPLRHLGRGPGARQRPLEPIEATRRSPSMKRSSPCCCSSPAPDRAGRRRLLVGQGPEEAEHWTCRCTHLRHRPPGNLPRSATWTW